MILAPRTEPIPGTSDLFPQEVNQWRFIEQTCCQIFSRFGFGEIRTPIIERTEVFHRSLGLETDIVQKEMYSFNDRGGREITLRPEGTAGVLRALVNGGISQGDEKRVFYFGPMFRGERPAAGRRRQFHQVGVECVGKISPKFDIECISILDHLLKALELKNYKILINSRGELADREPISIALNQFFSSHIQSMCTDCQRRHEKNVWRILDCKNEICREFILKCPPIVDLLGESSRIYFETVCEGIAELDINYHIEPRLVRGLDYYAQTVFEATVGGIGAQNSVAGGGRYEITFPNQRQPVLGVGFAAGIERLVLAMNEQGSHPWKEPSLDIYLVSLGELAQKENLKLANHLRTEGFSVQMDLEGRGMKAQLRSANKSGARFAFIRGQDEIEKGAIVFRNMSNSTQEEIPLEIVKEKLNSLL